MDFKHYDMEQLEYFEEVPKERSWIFWFFMGIVHGVFVTVLFMQASKFFMREQL